MDFPDERLRSGGYLLRGRERNDRFNRNRVLTGLRDGAVQRYCVFTPFDALDVARSATISRGRRIYGDVPVCPRGPRLGRPVQSGKVPVLSVWFVVGLVLASVGVFVGLVQRLSGL